MAPLRTIVPTLLFLFTGTVFCQAYISGEVTNAPDSAVVSLTFFNNTIEYTQITAASAKLGGSGHFAFRIPWDTAKPASLSIAEQYTRTFLSPGDSLHLTVDYDRFDSTLHYSGQGAAENNYMAADVLGNFEYAASTYMAFSDGNKYKLFVDSVERLSNALWKRYDKPGMSQAFRAYIRPELQYRFINPRYMFKVGYNQEKKEFYNKEVPPGYFDFLQAIDLNDQAAADNGTYAIALDRYLSTLHDSKFAWSDQLPKEPQMETWISENYNYRKSIFTGKVLDHQLTAFVKEQLERTAASPSFLDSLVRDYDTICGDPEYLAIIDRIHGRFKNVAPGQPAPAATLADSTGQEVHLSAYRGKVVYIDFWATWCVPCIASIPKSHALAEEYKDRTDVAFLFVNVNDTPERWRNFLRKEHSSGEDLYADEERSNRMRKEFNFDGIPHYVLLDKQGRFINSNVMGPEAARPMIEEALK
jgi:thiol-disulfide isomerase/thioredoxin